MNYEVICNSKRFYGHYTLLMCTDSISWYTTQMDGNAISLGTYEITTDFYTIFVLSINFPHGDLKFSIEFVCPVKQKLFSETVLWTLDSVFLRTYYSLINEFQKNNCAIIHTAPMVAGRRTATLLHSKSEPDNLC